ncbi:hypothetical protein Tsp_04281 [Trichinella spiralis]|uniref:hypothetical protein n=1 Tax=Trichinella spiralis TaxID=6334 RepID=UPI0001EFC110|nr:hypothetical protein Tsp_04281 [Trichinella spiralis]
MANRTWKTKSLKVSMVIDVSQICKTPNSLAPAANDKINCRNKILLQDMQSFTTVLLTFTSEKKENDENNQQHIPPPANVFPPILGTLEEESKASTKQFQKCNNKLTTDNEGFVPSHKMLQINNPN